MKNYFGILFILSMAAHAQELAFNQRNVHCEDKWVSLAPDNDGKHLFGFIYIDEQAGLTFNYEGSFVIGKEGRFELITNDNPEMNSTKVRMEPSNVQFALIPSTRFAELNIKAEPEWLANYKTGEGTAPRLFNWGYWYNAWGEYEKALGFLLKAEAISPVYKGLQSELAFSYNALDQFEPAEKALMKALKADPKDCYALKELAYTYSNMKNLQKSGETYRRMTKECINKTFLQEAAYNLAYRYFEIKDKTNLLKWATEVRKWSENADQYTQNLDLMIQELNK